MLLSERQIRALIADLILEGYKDDQRYLIEKYPEHADALSRLQPKWIGWLIARFGDSPAIEETHPFENVLITIEKFARKDAGIGKKYRANEQFREAIDTSFPPGGRSWAAPNDIMGMSADDMELILGLAERKKQRIDIDQAVDVEGDRVGKVGPWNLWLPTTRESSCEIAQYDPVTRKPKTKWCTARMANSNLFYSYIGKPGEDNILFYIIKDSPKDKEDWISLGFANGEPVLKSDDAGLSVDRDGTGMTPGRFKSILGPYYDEILRLLTEVVKDLGGTHPARQKLKVAAQDPEALKYLIRGLSKDEASAITAMVLLEPSASSEMLSAYTNDDNVKIQRSIARNPNAPHESLKRLASSDDVFVRTGVVENPSTPTEVLMYLKDDEMSWIRAAAKSNLEKRNVAEASLRKLVRCLVR